MDIPEEYLKEQLEKYSKYRSEFINATEHDDILMAILRAHMYIEKELVELTAIYFKHPTKFKDYSFMQRLNLLFALGVIEKQLYQPIEKINSIRNKISHKIEFTFNEETYNILYNSLSKDILQEHKKVLSVGEFLGKDFNYIKRTRILLAGIWTGIKAEVLTSFLKKMELAKEFEHQAMDELSRFEMKD